MKRALLLCLALTGPLYAQEVNEKGDYASLDWKHNRHWLVTNPAGLDVYRIPEGGHDGYGCALHQLAPGHHPYRRANHAR